MDIILCFSGFLCLVGTWVVIHGIKKKKKEKCLNLPPGSMGGWPFIGDFFGFISRNPATSLGRFMEDKVRRYGKIFKIKVMGGRVIISVDENFNRFVLLNDGKLFEQNLPKIFEKLFGETLKERVAGERHRCLKILMNQMLAVPRLQTHFFQSFELYALRTLNSWKEGVPIRAHVETKKLSFYMILKSLISLEPGEEDMEELWKLYGLLVKGFTSFPIDLPGTNYRKALNSRRAIMRIISRIMKKRIEKKNIQKEDQKMTDSDYLDILLDQSDYLPPEHVVDHLLEMLFAGFGTTSNALAMVIYFLGESPKALQQLKEEHMEIAKEKKKRGETRLTWEDYRLMEFTQCVIKETLRHGNISSYMHRRAKTDVQYKGYDIPRGSYVLLNLIGARLDGDVFNEPNGFDPWRWQNEPMIPKMMKNSLAFGEGVHKCVGGELVKMEFAIFLHHLVLNYEWELLGPANPTSHFVGLDFTNDLLIKVRPVSCF